MPVNQQVLDKALKKESAPLDLSKLPSAERAVAERYAKLGYDVALDASGKLQFSKGGVSANKRSEPQADNISSGISATDRIQLPDYKNPESRINYAKAFTEKYGPLMSKRGDTPLRINEKPSWGTDTSLNLAKKAASSFGIDPTLFYASSMEEGQSGLYPNETGQVRWSGNKEYPVSGLWSFGLDSFPDKYEGLVKKGYLPKDFDKNFTVGSDLGSKNKEGVSALFKTTDAAVQASAAMLKTYYDDVDSYVKQKGIQLSPKARDFFSLIGFNAGEGTARQMIEDYKRNGYLKNDAFLKERPTSGQGLSKDSYAKTYENTIRRIQMADALKQEGLVTDQQQQQQMNAALQKPSPAMK